MRTVTGMRDDDIGYVAVVAMLIFVMITAFNTFVG